MTGKTSSCGRRVGLNGVALIEQTFVVEAFEQVPQSLNIFVVVSDVGVFKVDPITHLICQFCPLVGVHHDVLTASTVVVVHADFLANILFGDTQALLHT